MGEVVYKEIQFRLVVFRLYFKTTITRFICLFLVTDLESVVTIFVLQCDLLFALIFHANAIQRLGKVKA